MHASREIPTAKWRVVSVIITCLADEAHRNMFIYNNTNTCTSMLAWMKLEYIQMYHLVCVRELDYNQTMRLYALNCISESECGGERE